MCAPLLYPVLCAAVDLECFVCCTLQIELDKTAEEFRRAHQERHDLIHQWESTIGQMKKRDSDIDKAATVSDQHWDGSILNCVTLFTAVFTQSGTHM